jgi:putative membrane protein
MAEAKLIFGFTRQQFATAVALLFHVIGFAGILFINKELFVKTTAINLLLMFFLIAYTQKGISKSFIIFFVFTFLGGIMVEIIGTNTGRLFGSYSYGVVLGPSLFKVPLIIGINWFLLMYCCGISMHKSLEAMLGKISSGIIEPKPFIKSLSIVIDGALMATFFDWLMEPVAIKLGYWKWSGDGFVPLYNCICWFTVSCIFLFLFSKSDFNKSNKFAVNLLLIQAMFFLLLRTFL